MKIFLSTLLTSALLCAPASASELIVNGGFETGTSAGWSYGAGEFVASGQTRSPHSGTYAAYFDSAQSATAQFGLSQTFADVVGQSYTLTFDLGYSQSAVNNPAAKTFEAYLNGHQFASENLAPAPRYTSSVGDYVLYTYHFIGTGSETLSFYDIYNDGFWALDDVSVQGPAVVATVTPEPPGLVLLGTAVLGAVWIMRRRVREA